MAVERFVAYLAVHSLWSDDPEEWKQDGISWGEREANARVDVAVVAVRSKCAAESGAASRLNQKLSTGGFKDAVPCYCHPRRLQLSTSS